MKTTNLAKQALVAAVYALITYALPALSYGPIQFRISEAMTLLAFYNPSYILGLTVGCVLANLTSPFGIVDVIIGSLATFFAVYSMSKIKNIWVASLCPALFNGLIIGLEIMILSEEPINFALVAGQIMLSEFLIVTVIGVPLFQLLIKNKKFAESLQLEDYTQTK